MVDLVARAVRWVVPGRQPPEYVVAVADYLCETVPDVLAWCETQDALPRAEQLIARLEALTPDGLPSEPCPTFEAVLADVAARLRAVEVVGTSEFSRGRRAGLEAAATRLGDWQRSPEDANLPVVSRTLRSSLTRPAHARYDFTLRERHRRVAEQLSKGLGGRAVPAELTDQIAELLPSHAELQAAQDELRRRLRRLHELEQEARVHWDPTPEQLADRARLAAEISRLAATFEPRGAHGSSYGTGFAAGYDVARKVLLETAEQVRAVELPGLTEEDLAYVTR